MTVRDAVTAFPEASIAKGASQNKAARLKKRVDSCAHIHPSVRYDRSGPWSCHGTLVVEVLTRYVRRSKITIPPM